MYNGPGIATAAMIPTSGLTALGWVDTLGTAVGVTTVSFALLAASKLLPKSAPPVDHRLRVISAPPGSE